MNCLTATQTGSCAIAIDSNGWNIDGGFNRESGASRGQGLQAEG